MLDSQNGWSTDFNNYRVVSIASSKLKLGRNVLAVMVQQNWGGAYFDCGVLRIEGTKAPLKLTSDKWHTFVAPGHNVDFNSTGIKAYKIVDIVADDVPYAKTEEVSIVPADEAVLVRSDKGAGTYQIPVTQTPASLDGNMLKATTASLSVTQENSIYSIAEHDDWAAFFPVKAGSSLAKGKAYLDLTGRNINASCIFLDLDDPTAIIDLNDLKDLNDPKDLKDPKAPKNLKDPVFNLSGQSVGKSSRGIYIVNGKKVLYGDKN